MKQKNLCAAVVAICVAAALPSFAARTVAISAYDDATREVSLSFGGSSSVAENVYLAYGPSDCGGHFHRWPNSVNIGTVAADATTMTYTLPAAITAGTFYRFFVGDCPYDAELEYIKGDGTSWINTDYVPSSANKVEMQMLFEAFLSGGTSGYEAFFCARNTSSKNTFMAIHIVLMGYLQRVVNGGGRIAREMALGSKRLDLCVEFGKFRYAVELKMKRNFSPTESPAQLVGYLDHLKLPEGWMAIFDDDASKSWDEKIYSRDEVVDGKTIHFIGL